jgi:hypothetical protein
MFICGNGETIHWGSNEEVKPCPTMKQIEVLGSYAVAGYHNEVVEPMLEQLREYRELLRKVIRDNHIEMVLTPEVEKKVQCLSMMIDNTPEWVLDLEAKSKEEADEADEADKIEWKNGEMTKGKWVSNFDKCDICGTSIKGTVEWFVDGRMKGGSWALMCPRCFESHGVGLGIGFGQKYDGTTAELIEGGFKKGEVE